MLNLKKVEIYGFKSFADKTELTFNHAVTGFVGPNGCGKSNVSDAIRWVLGEQNARLLRGKNMQDLIFSGTDSRKGMSYCEVSLHLDNRAHIFDVDYDDVIISRKLFRTNESEYYINRAPVRLKDVLDMLRGAGLGREGYAIVGQGRMDAILTARPLDRRAIFEEALGISRFRVSKIDTERKLAKTRDNLLRINDIIAELERQLTPLKKQSEQAEKYGSLMEELKYHEINSYIYSYDNASANKDSLNKKITALAAELTELKRNLDAANAAYEQQKVKLSDVDMHITGLRQEQLRLSVKIEHETGEIKLLNERVKHLSEQSKAHDAAINDDKSQIDKAKARADQTAQQRQLRESELATQNMLLTSLNEQYYAVSDKSNILAERAESLQGIVLQRLNVLSEQKSRAAALQSEHNTVSARLNRILQNEEEANRRLAALKTRQSRELSELIAGSTQDTGIGKIAADIEKHLSEVNKCLPNLMLEEELPDKISALVADIGEKCKAQLKGAVTVENWQRNLMLLSALSERMSKFVGLTENERAAAARIMEEKNEAQMRLSSISGALKSQDEVIAGLAEKYELERGAQASVQREYAQIKSEKDKLAEQVTACRLKIQSINSYIITADNSINSDKQAISRLTNDIAMRTKQIASNKAAVDELFAQIAASGGNAEDVNSLSAVNAELSDADAIKKDIQAKFNTADASRTGLQSQAASLTDRLSREQFNLERIDSDIEQMQQRILEEYNLTYSSAMRFKDEAYNYEKSKDESARYRSMIAKLGFVNINAVQEYADTKARYDDLISQLTDIKAAEADLKKILAELTREITVRFNDGFEKVNENFARIFRELFAGGTARMSVEADEELDEMDFGIEIEAQPPGKRLQNISLLSGGERTLTAAAILFAILKLRPMPFCVLDEIEAALDDANADRIARYIQKFSKETQFLVITHKKPTMEACSVLYGVTMEEKGISKLMSVQLADAV